MGLDEFRQKIDNADEKIIDAIAERMDIISELAEYKKFHKIPIMDPKREEMLLKKVKNLAKKKNLDEDTIEIIFKKILEESKRIQREIF